MNILITGARGFVGRNLVENLKAIRDGKTVAKEKLSFQIIAPKDDAAADEGASGKVISGLMKMVLEERAQAKSAKDWGRSDAIRDHLKELGITVKDTKNGAEWTIE